MKPGFLEPGFLLRSLQNCPETAARNVTYYESELVPPTYKPDPSLRRFCPADVADQAVKLSPSPSAQVAAERIFKAATGGGDMFSAHAAIGVASVKGSAQ